MTDRSMIIALWLLLPLGLAAPLLAGRSSPPEPDWEMYKVIVERNIFLKDRSATAERVPTQASNLPPWPPLIFRPESNLVLTGIVCQSGKHIAFLENTRTGITSRLALGDPVAGGRITQIALDYVLYESNGERTAIEVGHNLDGGLASQTSAPAGAEDVGLLPLPSKPSTPAQTLPPNPTAAPPAGLGQAAAVPPATGGASPEDESAVLERLRQRRQKELSEQ